jgi:RHH-type rel operon transcriptional repressor/antitoxin RelB
MSETAVLKVRVPHDLKSRLDRLAKTISTSTSALTEAALIAYVNEQERQIARIQEGLADAAAGRVVAHKDVARWLDSWGTENELPPPE